MAMIYPHWNVTILLVGDLEGFYHTQPDFVGENNTNFKN